ncbi:MAG TPA: SAM-dependent methyltransferase [Candidatus Dormibacteraeota bacterium]|nr:SAM-dependent methyltransferase [Candidatus Dormibacteraeota bacterium]
MGAPAAHRFASGVDFWILGKINSHTGRSPCARRPPDLSQLVRRREAIALPAYALLTLPTQNRVYGRAAVELGLAELASTDRLLLGGRLGPPELAAIGGRAYYVVRTDELGGDALDALARLSTVYAAFELRGDLLAPLALPAVEHLPDDLVTTQRYQGKTNEHLTRLMVNLALAAAGDAPAGERRTVLDPACGRGTTLNQALLYGLDAAGMEIEKAAVEAYAHFLRTWLQNHRLKHRLAFRPVRRDGRTVAHALEAELSPSREELERGRPQRVRVVAADSVDAGDHFRAGSAGALVADLPYGVQHGGRAAGRRERSPEALVEAALPAWRRVLRTGAGACLAWNTRVLPRSRLVELLAGAGFEPLDEPPFDGFAHRVDQSIQRDLLVAVAS